MRKLASRPETDPAPMYLAAVQRLMALAVTAPTGARQHLPREHSAVASALIKPNSRLSSFARLQIYHQQYWWRLQGAFMEDFPGLRAVLGGPRFHRLRDAYLATHGSTSWNLRDLGQDLEIFLREHPTLSSPYGALALDMAKVEWARVIAFDGAEHPRFDPGQLASSRPPGRLRIGLQPYLTLLELSHPIDRLLSRLKQGKVQVRPCPPSRQTIYLAVHRQEFAVYYKRLEPGEFHLLSALHAGFPLEAACAQVLEHSADHPSKLGERIQGWFATWTRLGWLCDPR